MPEKAHWFTLPICLGILAFIIVKITHMHVDCPSGQLCGSWPSTTRTLAIITTSILFCFHYGYFTDHMHRRIYRDKQYPVAKTFQGKLAYVCAFLFAIGFNLTIDYLFWSLLIAHWWWCIFPGLVYLVAIAIVGGNACESDEELVSMLFLSYFAFELAKNYSAYIDRINKIKVQIQKSYKLAKY